MSSEIKQKRQTMVHGELREKANLLPNQSLKENAEPVVSVSRHRGRIAKMASVSKPAKPSNNTTILKQRNNISVKDTSLVTTKNPSSKVMMLGPTPGTHRTPKTIQTREKQVKGKKTHSLFPPLAPKPSGEPKPSKVVFQTSIQEGWPKRRLSIPNESHVPHRSALKKRNSICTDSVYHGGQSSLQDVSALWSIPWERETHFPHIGPKGLLLFHDEAIPVPPVQRRLSLKANYSYSQEFTKALSDLHSRPVSRHESQLLDRIAHQKSDEKTTSQSQMSKHEHFASRQELSHPVTVRSPTRRYSE